MSGENCAAHLLARISAIKLSALGVDVDETTILETLSQRGGTLSQMAGGRVKFHRSTEEEPLVMETPSGWRVLLCLDDERASGFVSVHFRNPAETGDAPWLSQDPPDGSAAKCHVRSGPNPYERGSEFAFVHRETHLSLGLLWDPDAVTAAEHVYRPDGSLLFLKHYQGGVFRGRDENSPAAESFWDNGAIQIAEYGDSHCGCHRPMTSGPAYQEFYPNGQCAAKVFAELPPTDNGAAGAPRISGAFFFQPGGEPVPTRIEPSSREGQKLLGPLFSSSVTALDRSGSPVRQRDELPRPVFVAETGGGARFKTSFAESLFLRGLAAGRPIPPSTELSANRRLGR